MIGTRLHTSIFDGGVPGYRPGLSMNHTPEFATRTVGDWNQLPAVVVEEESPAAFKNQLDRLAPVACRMP